MQHDSIPQTAELEAMQTREQSDILNALIEGKSTNANAASALANACQSPWALVALSLQGSMESRIEAHDIERSLADLPFAFAAALKDKLLVTFLSYQDAEQFIEAASARMGANVHSAAVSLPFSSAADVEKQYRLLHYVLEGNGEGVHRAEDHALQFLVSELTASVDAKSLLHPALEKLRHYDDANQSNLLNTLKVYLEYDRNAQRCASVLYLHRNSLQYRVRRIQEIAGIDLDQPSERAYLRLSFLLS